MTNIYCPGPFTLGQLVINNRHILIIFNCFCYCSIFFQLLHTAKTTVLYFLCIHSIFSKLQSGVFRLFSSHIVSVVSVSGRQRSRGRHGPAAVPQSHQDPGVREEAGEADQSRANPGRDVCIARCSPLDGSAVHLRRVLCRNAGLLLLDRVGRSLLPAQVCVCVCTSCISIELQLHSNSIQLYNCDSLSLSVH